MIRLAAHVTGGEAVISRLPRALGARMRYPTVSRTVWSVCRFDTLTTHGFIDEVFLYGVMDHHQRSGPQVDITVDHCVTAHSHTHRTLRFP